MRGEFDLTRVDEFDARLRRALSVPGVRLVAVDMADATFIDCSTIGVLLKALREADGAGIRLCLIHIDHHLVRRVLEITGALGSLTAPPPGGPPAIMCPPRQSSHR